MFSFIKALQGLLKNLKKKKGLWFTLLSLMSIVGIALSMYLLTNMTKNVAKDVYVNMSNSYKTILENKLESKEKDFRKIYIGLNSNTNFRNNLNNTRAVEAIVKTYNDNFVEAGFEDLEINFYSTVNQVNQYRNSINSVINRKTTMYGLEVITEGTYIVYAQTVLRGEDVLGVIEIREPILKIKDEFEKINATFVFLIEENMLANLSLEARTGNYRDVVDTLKVAELKYDGQFFANIIEEGKEEFKKFKDVGYSVNEVYFKTYKKVSDVNGATIGYIILGEQVEGSGAFVNIVDNMTKSVTTVALGLVISILLFMF